MLTTTAVLMQETCRHAVVHHGSTGQRPLLIMSAVMCGGNVTVSAALILWIMQCAALQHHKIVAVLHHRHGPVIAHIRHGPSKVAQPPPNSMAL